MAAIVKELTIEAATPRVWSALTSSDEIAHWWTDESPCHTRGRLSVKGGRCPLANHGSSRPLAPDQNEQLDILFTHTMERTNDVSY